MTGVGKVRASNPVFGGRVWFRRRDAEKYVREGRAKFLGENVMELVESDPSYAAAKQRVADKKRIADRAYDRAVLRTTSVEVPEGSSVIRQVEASLAKYGGIQQAVKPCQGGLFNPR